MDAEIESGTIVATSTLSMSVDQNIEIRECTTLDEFAACVALQREVFALPDLEISPVRHLVVTRNAGGFTLGAFSDGVLVGFVLSVPAFLRGEKAFYSHMTAVSAAHQSYGIGARLKWAQRERSLREGVRFIKWTFEPVKARNAFFNLEKLGAIVREYHANFYGVDYPAATPQAEKIGLASDRLFGEWDLESSKVRDLADNAVFIESRPVVREIVIPPSWHELVSRDAKAALLEQVRIRSQFETAFSDGLVCRGFRRDDRSPAFLLFED